MDDIWIVENAGYKIEKIDNKLQPVIYLFSRNFNDKFVTITHKVYNFRPYFYCPANETDRELPFNCEYDNEIIIDALGREVVKVYTDIPPTIGKIRDQWSFTDMSDFLFEKRFLVDYKIKYAYIWDEDTNRPTPVELDEILEPRVVFYDIEVRVPQDIQDFPEVYSAKFPVTTIQVEDSYTNKKIVFTYGIPQTNFNNDNSTHIAVSRESDVYKLFITYINEINPDLMTGWFSSGFDLPYLFKRSENIGVSIEKLSPLGRNPYIRFDEKENKFKSKLPGRNIFDMQDMFKKLTAVDAQRETYALKPISAEFGFEYNDYGIFIDKLICDKNYDTLLQYCVNDVIALDNIATKTGVIKFYESLRKRNGCFLDDTQHNSVLIEMKFLHFGMKPMPRKMYSSKDDGSFEGAIVHQSPPGIHKNVHTIDISSLYPNCIVGFELSPDIDKLVPKIVKYGLDEREKLRAMCKADPDNKNLYYEHQSVKIENNSIYGVVGSKSFRLFDEEVAGKVTEWGRKINLLLKSKSESMGLTAIGGDSVGEDSLIKIFTKNPFSKLQNWQEKSKIIKIKDLFTRVDFRIGNKEYCILFNVYTQSVNNKKEIELKQIKYVMRHKTNKQMYEVSSDNIHSYYNVIVTEDHSLIDKNLNEVKPTDLNHIIINSGLNGIKKLDCVVEKIPYDSFVYDIEVDDNHNFFANDILVHNTDSLFLIGVDTVEDAKKYEKIFNDILEEFSIENNSKVIFKLKFEKFFKTLMFKFTKDGKAAKKKYIGRLIWEEGRDCDELYNKGTELTRSDSSKITKQILETFIDYLLMKDDINSAKEYIKKMYLKVKNGEVDPYDISIPREVRKASKESPWKRGIDNTRKYLGYSIEEGTKPRLIHLKGEPSEICIDDIVDIGEYKNKIDWNTTLDKTVTSKLKSYVDAAGMKWDEVIHGQKSLDDWF